VVTVAARFARVARAAARMKCAASTPSHSRLITFALSGAGSLPHLASHTTHLATTTLPGGRFFCIFWPLGIQFTALHMHATHAVNSPRCGLPPPPHRTPDSIAPVAPFICARFAWREQHNSIPSTSFSSLPYSTLSTAGCMCLRAVASAAMP